MKETSKSLVAQANAAHEEFLSIGTVAVESVMQWVNKAREVGIYLRSLRSDEPKWEQLTLLSKVPNETNEPRLVFGPSHAKAFIRVADRLKDAPASTPIEAIAAMKEASMLQGVLDFPEGHGRQKLHTTDPTSFIIRHVMEVQAAFNKDLREVITDWPTDKKQYVRDQLRPIVDIYEALAA